MIFLILMVSQNPVFLLEYTALLFIMLDVGGEEEKEYFLRVPPLWSKGKPKEQTLTPAHGML